MVTFLDGAAWFRSILLYLLYLYGEKREPNRGPLGLEACCPDFYLNLFFENILSFLVILAWKLMPQAKENKHVLSNQLHHDYGGNCENVFFSPQTISLNQLLDQKLSSSWDVFLIWNSSNRDSCFFSPFTSANPFTPFLSANQKSSLSISDCFTGKPIYTFFFISLIRFASSV